MPGEKILVVEDEPAIAVDIALNLENNGYQVVDVFYKAEEAAEYLKENKVDLIMLDINLSGKMTGIDLARIVDKEWGIPFIYLTSFSDDHTVEEAADTYPSSYLVKPFREDDLAPAVKIALKRKKGDKMNRLPSLFVINKDQLSKITKSEYSIIKGIWNGLTNTEIASQSSLSPNTIKTHMRNIYLKLDVHSRTELVKHLREIK